MGLVIAAFIITAVFVGYHASQESSEKVAEIHGELIGANPVLNQAKQNNYLLFISDLSK